MFILLRNQWQKEILAIGQGWEYTAYRERRIKRTGDFILEILKIILRFKH